MRVRIYKPSKSPMQSGRGRTKLYQIEPELDAARTPEPLMGWVGSDDTLSTMLRLKFETAEQAIAFATKQGWGYTLDSANPRKIAPRSYIDNFSAKKKAS